MSQSKSLQEIKQSIDKILAENFVELAYTIEGKKLLVGLAEMGSNNSAQEGWEFEFNIQHHLTVEQ